ncbi:MAG: MaoC/PaaZ C-terminal domain-containing protein [Oligoflexia bacterium]|nr:MaoC/PaaZ C-terminal domain-containing protein [Oligoflexia bacterium]
MTLTAGTEIPFIRLDPITQPQLRRYADASGDHNAIHLDEEVAKSMGLPGVIAHGMLSAGFLGERALRAVLDEAGRNDLHMTRLQTRFKSMVQLGDQISVGGVVKEATPERVVLDLSAKNQKDEIVTVATAEFSL